MTRRNWVKEFRAATATFDWTVVDELARSYADHLYAVPSLPDNVGVVLQTLREALRYAELEIVADAALAHSLCLPAVRRQYAQALVDRGKPAAALRLYRELADDEALSLFDHLEAQGGIGRCYKELFLACTEPERSRQFFSRSLDAYLTTFWKFPDRVWHGINAVAMLARAERDGLALTVQPPAAADLAAAVLQIVDEAPRDTWTELSACEAALALGRDEDAVERLEAFLATKPDGFTVASFHRQLLTVWELDTFSSPGTELLALLRAALLEFTGGQVTVGSADVRASRLDDDPRGVGLEHILGTERFQSLEWYRRGLVRCRAVTSIQNLSGVGIGTGFLVAGRDLHRDLPPLVVLTNHHVVPGTLEPEDTLLAFHGLDDDPGRQARFRVRRECWSQPAERGGLDTTILEPDGQPEGVVPTPLAAKLPRKPLKDRRAYLIGHPRGLSQPQFSLQDNILLDYDRQWVHYRSPTEPGSSGSPVFNDDWQLIGLHHGGGHELKQLNHRGGIYAANEGVTIECIRRWLKTVPPLPR
ncbi:serine protease [Actinomycetospora rhizophila]|uniref:Serine protease n=1 Tax=Actinomycetospora rhizophila TaxID=1416876 RepID=A0ABV9ZE69_9PSEU